MSAFLTALVSAVLTWLAQFLGRLGVNWLQTQEAEGNVAAVADNDEQQLQSAHSQEDKINAANQINQDTFGSDGGGT